VKARITEFSSHSEYFFAEGCHIIELANSEDDPDVSIARARVEPGRTTRWHYLEGTVERYVITQGSGVVEVADFAPRKVGPGDVVLIPAGERQRIRNSGSGDLVFLAICSPRFTEGVYVDIDGEQGN